MKVYVIKNKEGKYFSDFFGKYVDELQFAMLLRDNEKGVYRLPNDCQWQEVTLCEGDIEKELEELKAKYETAEYWSRRYDNCQQELEVYKKALELAVLTQCNKSRQDLIKQICKFNFTREVYDFFLRQARKELGEKDEV